MRAITAALCFLAIAPISALACKCQLSLDVCGQTSYSNVVFAGTVESITPNFMTRWEPASPEPIARMNRALGQYLQDHSEVRLSTLKDAVRSVLPNLAPEDQRRLEGAAGAQALANLLGSVLDGSRRVRFHVRALFRKAGDDHKSGDDGDDDVPDFIDVLTPFGDCGNDWMLISMD